MNKQQRDYEKAKQAKQRVEMKMEAREESFLKGRGLMDSEGTEADSLYKIEDEALFDMACKEFDLLPGIPELNKEYARAGEALRAAEEALVEYALSIAPPATARTLRESAKKQLYDPAEDYNSHNEIGYQNSKNKEIKTRLSHRPDGEKEKAT